MYCVDTANKGCQQSSFYTFLCSFDLYSCSISCFVAHMHTCWNAQCILPLQAVKGNYPRILTALNQLKSVARDVSVDSRSRGCVLDGLQETLVQFQRLNQTSRPVCCLLPSVAHSEISKLPHFEKSLKLIPVKSTIFKIDKICTCT